ncbi:hypothetical protein B0H19DRAFT_1084424 [Mycena capillaripes]|nr:hypothetical protein B0H19DRAFT_1084424 [Mycena capillaripes]
MPADLEQSSSTAEILAAIIGIQDSNLHTALEIESQRDTLLKCLKGLPQWEDQGWVHVRNGEIIQHLLALIRSRTAPTTFIDAKKKTRAASGSFKRRCVWRGKAEISLHMTR